MTAGLEAACRSQPTPQYNSAGTSKETNWGVEAMTSWSMFSVCKAEAQNAVRTHHQTLPKLTAPSRDPSPAPSHMALSYHEKEPFFSTKVCSKSLHRNVICASDSQALCFKGNSVKTPQKIGKTTCPLDMFCQILKYLFCSVLLLNYFCSSCQWPHSQLLFGQQWDTVHLPHVLAVKVILHSEHSKRKG